ncbi:MAG TPA: amidohydrolase [Candidatus Avipropionibacterium avicola]|uniref:Amidohydrolase n=1 Tax=Candidatus Avipropionibacterium avicola TaxID=2840701 RepID=A0A9D1GWU3_9ACTN|nr:amidohydrolase [Candidatus Avipropionibacterium avicola]
MTPTHDPGPARNDGHLHLGFDTRHGPDGGTAHFLQVMDDHRIRRACVVTPAVHGWDNTVTATALREHPDRFVGIARLDPAGPDPVRMARTLLERGFRGFRLSPSTPGDPDWLTDEVSHRVAAALERHGGVVCLHGGPGDLPAAARFARAHPGVTVLIDHGGRPDPSAPDHGFGPELRDLAGIDSVVIKTPNSSAFSHEPPPHGDLATYHRLVVEAFGAHRVMWGSDWPVCLSAGPYRAALEAAEAALAGTGPTEQALVLGGTFDRVFASTSPPPKGSS